VDSAEGYVFVQTEAQDRQHDILHDQVQEAECRDSTAARGDEGQLVEMHDHAHTELKVVANS
jgi:hypothetical protein